MKNCAARLQDTEQYRVLRIKAGHWLRQQIIKMPSFFAVFMCDNNYKRDGDKFYYRLPAVVTELCPLQEELTR